MVWNVTATRAAGGICYFIPILPCRSSFAAPRAQLGRRLHSSSSQGTCVCLQSHLSAAFSTASPRVSPPGTKAVPGVGRWRMDAWGQETFAFINLFFSFYSVLLLPLPFDFGGLRSSFCPYACPMTFTMIYLYKSVWRVGLSCRFLISQLLNFTDVYIWSTCVNNAFESWALSQAVMLLRLALCFDGTASFILGS